MDNLKGMAWMTLAMLAFAVTDMILVFATRELPLGQILFLFGIGGAVLFGAWARVQGHRWVTPVLLMRPVMLRNGAEVLATGTFITALSLIPLSTLSAVIQANPLLVTLGAAVFLGEKVGWRRWAAIGVGLLGVLVIIRPGGEAFDPNILFAVAAAIGLSLRDLATRPVPRHVPTTLLASYSFAAVGIAGAVVMPFFRRMADALARHGGDHPRRRSDRHAGLLRDHRRDAGGRDRGGHADALHAPCLCFRHRGLRLRRDHRRADPFGRGDRGGHGALYLLAGTAGRALSARPLAAWHPFALPLRLDRAACYRAPQSLTGEGPP